MAPWIKFGFCGRTARVDDCPEHPKLTPKKDLSFSVACLDGLISVPVESYKKLLWQDPQMHIDDITAVPVELYSALLAAGREARERGQHMEMFDDGLDNSQGDSGSRRRLSLYPDTFCV